MRGSLPSLGAVFELANSSASRIPHLQHHFLTRHARPTPQLPSQCWTSRLRRSAPRRPVSNIVIEHPITDSDLHKHSVIEQEFSSTETKQDVGLDQRGNDAPIPALLFDQILAERHPARVLHALLWSAAGQDFTRQASPEAFEDALTAVDPQYLIRSVKDTYRFLKKSLSTDPIYRWTRHIEERFETFSAQIDEIIRTRQDAGHQLTLGVCRHVLDCARHSGDGAMAKYIFEDLMPAEGIERDLHCYNHFMEAVCWSKAWSKSEQWRLRVTPRILQIRSRYKRPDDLKGHRVFGELGIRDTLLTAFKQLVSEGHKSDEATFTTIMGAMGREGDMEGVQSVLRSVYNINVDLLSQFDEEEIETPTFYEEGSPLRPSGRLLFAVAHIYGSNNRAETAYQLVDYISRQYDLQIPFEVWLELFEWTYVLHLWRPRSRIRQGQGLGTVNRKSLDRLYTVMTDQPHNVTPNVAILTLLARSYRWSRTSQYQTYKPDYGRVRRALWALRAARSTLDENREELQKVTDELIWYVENIHQFDDPEPFLPAEWYDLRQRFIIKSLQVDRDIQLVSVAIRLFLEERRWFRDDVLVGSKRHFTNEESIATDAQPTTPPPRREDHRPIEDLLRPWNGPSRSSLFTDAPAPRPKRIGQFVPYESRPRAEKETRTAFSKPLAQEWERRALPRLLEEFFEYMPNKFRYETTTGFVEMGDRITREQAIALRWNNQSTIVGIIRAAIDTDDYAQMRRGIRNLPTGLQEWRGRFRQRRARGSGRRGRVVELGLRGAIAD